MSWAALASNQCISFNNLQNAVNTGVFTLKNTIPVSTEQITKADADYYVNINTSFGPYAAKASNQLVVKSNLQACTNLPYSYTIIYSYNDGDPNFFGFTSSGAACSATTTAVTVYSSSSSIGVGTELYFDFCGNTQLNASSYDTGFPYFKYGSNYITFENWDATNGGYVVRSITSCTANVTFYGVMGDLSSSFGTLYYSTDNSTWNPIAASFSYTCGVIDVITVSSGATVYVSIGDPSSTAYYYNAQVGTSCPFNSATYCGSGSKFSTVVSGNIDIAITQYVTGGDILAC